MKAAHGPGARILSHRLLAPACILGVLLAVASCSSGDAALQVTAFLAQFRTPAPGQVYLAIESIERERATLACVVHEVQDVHEAFLVITYPPEKILPAGWTPGAFLEKDGATVTYEVNEVQPGRLEVRVLRGPGSVSSGPFDEVLVRLGFRAVVAGNAALDFDAASELRDEAGAPLTGITFFGGVLVAE